MVACDQLMYHKSFKLPLLPSLPNALNRKHWAVKTKEKNHIQSVLNAISFKERPLIPLQKAQIIFTRCSSRQPDYDNLAYSFKYVLDGLILSKIICNDNPNVLSDISYRWVKTPRKLSHCIIEVIER